MIINYRITEGVVACMDLVSEMHNAANRKNKCFNKTKPKKIKKRKNVGFQDLLSMVLK